MAHSGLPGSRFAVPVSDTDEVALRESEGCAQRVTCLANGVVLCLLFANSENCALTSYCTLKCAIRDLK